MSEEKRTNEEIASEVVRLFLGPTLVSQPRMENMAADIKAILDKKDAKIEFLWEQNARMREALRHIQRPEPACSQCRDLYETDAILDHHQRIASKALSEIPSTDLQRARQLKQEILDLVLDDVPH